MRKASAKVGTFQITAKCFENFFKKNEEKREKQGQKGEKGRQKAKKKKKREQGEGKAQGRERGGFRQKGRRRNNDTKAIGHSNEGNSVQQEEAQRTIRKMEGMG